MYVKAECIMGLGPLCRKQEHGENIGENYRVAALLA